MMYNSGNKVPTEYFIVQGSGESELTHHAGSFHKAMRACGSGLQETNFVPYSSVISAEAKRIDPPKEFLRGTVLDVIQARCDGQKGELLTAGLIVGKLTKKTNGSHVGCYICEMTGNMPSDSMESQLIAILNDMLTGEEDFELSGYETFIESSIPKTEFGTALVIVGFTGFRNTFQSSYCEMTNFMGKKCTFDKAKYVLLAIPFEGTVTYGKGAAKGPYGIAHASQFVEDYDIDTSTQVIKKGIHTAEPVGITESVEEMMQEVRSRAVEILNSGKFLVSIGGEHSVSIPLFAAMEEVHGEYSILALGANGDYRNSYDASPYNHACVMRRAKDYCSNRVLVATRSLCMPEMSQIEYDKTFFDVDIGSNELWVDDVIDELGENVYVTLDVNVFDPAFIRTGTPEPGGLQYNQVLKLLKTLARKRNVIGFDVVELSPTPGNVAPEFGMAKLIYQFLSYIDAFGKNE